jgi:transcription termination factor NusB
MGLFSNFVENKPMLFRTELHPKKSSFQISHSDKLLSIGSCFADCMGNRFDEAEFEINSNPFGVLFNPLSIFRNLERALKKEAIETDQIIESRASFFHYQFHSEINANSAFDFVEKANAINHSVSERLATADYLFITLGTAFVYYLKGTNVSVANCHKQPADVFDKKMLSVDEIVQAFGQFYAQLMLQNPNIKILITVSPVRHTKDTLELNSVSKAVLRLSCHEIVKQNASNVSYFPAFEIMTDDLRDYRFYKEDMIHPTIQAETYIWKKFAECYFNEETVKINKEIVEIQSALNHRPFNTKTEEYERFIKKTEEKILKLNDKAPSNRLLEKLALKLSSGY